MLAGACFLAIAKLYTPKDQAYSIEIIKTNTIAHFHAKAFLSALHRNVNAAIIAYLTLCAAEQKPPEKDELEKVIQTAIETTLLSEGTMKKDIYTSKIACGLSPSLLTKADPLSCLGTIAVEINATKNITKIVLYNNTLGTRTMVRTCSADHVCTTILLPKVVRP